jgi:hypothetical protein
MNLIAVQPAAPILNLSNEPHQFRAIGSAACREDRVNDIQHHLNRRLCARVIDGDYAGGMIRQLLEAVATSLLALSWISTDASATWRPGSVTTPVARNRPLSRVTGRR